MFAFSQFLHVGGSGVHEGNPPPGLMTT